jgi:hypothetical protein
MTKAQLEKEEMPNMYPPIQPKNTMTLSVKDSISRSPLQCGLFLKAFAIACFALSPVVRAVDPPPDGGYPGANTAEGTDALFSLATGGDNTAIGFRALYRNTTGNDNTAVGDFALRSNTADHNTATGVSALQLNTTGSYNTASGIFALANNTTGSYNTASGATALQSSTGDYNTATGFQALQQNGSGSYNTATGFASLPINTTGVFNTADGVFALFTNSSGYNNLASGVSALYNNTTGHDNTALGYQALGGNTAGNNNVGIGGNSGGTGTNNTAAGYNALLNASGNNNIAVGVSAGSNLTTGSNNIDIGANVLAKAGEANTIRIGKQGTQTATFIAGIYNVNEGGTIKPVYVNSSGRLGTQPPASAQRFKEQITPMSKTSEAILSLKPVTFRYKGDDDRTPQFGLIAEEVASVNPDLVLRDEDGQIYTVRYEAVNAMLLNEFLKEHHKAQQQDADIKELKGIAARQNAMIVKQQRQIDAFAADLQKANTRSELRKARGNVAANE